MVKKFESLIKSFTLFITEHSHKPNMNKDLFHKMSANILKLMSSILQLFIMVKDFGGLMHFYYALLWLP